MAEYSSKKAIVGGLVANVAIAVVKAIAGALTGSAVMLAEAAHSVVDAGNGSLLLVGQRRARRPASEAHPFGHGMEVYFWTVIVGIVVFVAGGGFSIAQGILEILRPEEKQRVWPNYLVLAAAALFEGISLAIAVREFRRYRRDKRYEGSLLRAMRVSKNPPMFMVVVEDSLAMVGLLIAFAGVTLARLLHAPRIDGVASIVIGLLLMLGAGFLINESRALLVGEGARHQIVQDIHAALRRPEVTFVDEVRTMQLGPESVLVALTLRLDRRLSLEAAARVAGDIEQGLRAQHASIQHVLFSLKDAV